MEVESQYLQQGIQTLEIQRTRLGDGVVDACTATLRRRQVELHSQADPCRRYITTMVAVIDGLTTLMPIRDPEEIAETLDSIRARLERVAQMYGGVCLTDSGCMLTAVWGADHAHEDDAEKALQCALTYRHELAVLGKRIGAPLSLQIGVSTGDALLRAGAHGELRPIGEPPTIATRLAYSAAPDSILISHATYRHIAASFETVAQPAQSLPSGEALRSYQVLQELAQAHEGGSVAPIATPMVGRQAELSRLLMALREVVTQGRAQTITVIGEAGLGKSRLLFEFARLAVHQPQSVMCLRARALRQHSQLAYRLVRDLIGVALGVSDGDPASVVYDRLTEDMRALVGDQADSYAYAIGRLLGYDIPSIAAMAELQDDPQQISRLATRYLAEILRRRMATTPLVIVIDDAHWADRRSLDLLMQLRQQCAESPFLIIKGGRPGASDDARESWRESQSQPSIMLEPLDTEASLRLINALLEQSEPLPSDLSATIVRTAEGNPYYLEELVRMLVEDGAIARVAERWRPTALHAELKVPATLTALLQARIDRLGASERRVLQSAAVIGRVFWDSCVARLYGPGAVEALAALERRGLIFRQMTSAFPGEREFIIKHTLLRDVAYDRVMRRQRPAHHRVVAHWLERTAQRHGRLDEYQPLIAEHYEAAGMHHEAAVHLQAAAAYATRQGDHAAARGLLERALEQIDDESPARGQALLLLGDTCAGMFDHLQASEAYRASMALAEAHGDAELRADALVGLGSVLREIGSYAGARSAYGNALRATTDPRRHMAIWEGLAQVAMALSDWEECAGSAAAGLEAARATGDRAVEAQLLAILGTATFRGSDRHDDAQTQLEQSLAIGGELGDLRIRTLALIGLADLAETLGRNAAARDAYRQCLDLLEQSKDERIRADVWRGLGEMYLRQGDLSQAAEAIERSLTAAITIDDPLRMASCLVILGHLTRHGGDDRLAAEHYDHALMIARPIGAARPIAAALRGLGQLAERAGAAQETQALFDESLATARGAAEREQELRTLIALALGRLRDGRIDDAIAQIGAALTAVQSITGWPVKALLLAIAARVALGAGMLDEAAEWGSAALVGATDPEVGAVIEQLHSELAAQRGGDWYVLAARPQGSLDSHLTPYCQIARERLAPARQVGAHD